MPGPEGALQHLAHRRLLRLRRHAEVEQRERAGGGVVAPAHVLDHRARQQGRRVGETLAHSADEKALVRDGHAELGRAQRLQPADGEVIGDRDQAAVDGDATHLLDGAELAEGRVELRVRKQRDVVARLGGERQRAVVHEARAIVCAEQHRGAVRPLVHRELDRVLDALVLHPRRPVVFVASEHVHVERTDERVCVAAQHLRRVLLFQHEHGTQLVGHAEARGDLVAQRLTRLLRIVIKVQLADRSILRATDVRIVSFFSVALLRAGRRRNGDHRRPRVGAR